MAHEDYDIPGLNIRIVLSLGSSVYYQHSIFYLRSFYLIVECNSYYIMG